MENLCDSTNQLKLGMSTEKLEFSHHSNYIIWLFITVVLFFPYFSYIFFSDIFHESHCKSEEIMILNFLEFIWRSYYLNYRSLFKLMERLWFYNVLLQWIKSGNETAVKINYNSIKISALNFFYPSTFQHLMLLYNFIFCFIRIYCHSLKIWLKPSLWYTVSSE